MYDSILLVGCGNMGHAMLTGWMKGDPRPAIHVVEPDADLRKRAAETGAAAVGTAGDLPPALRPGVVVLAVKPQVLGAVLPDYASFAGTGSVFLSVAAGLPIGRIEAALPPGASVLRCMPNTPAAIGAGVMALCANAHATTAEIDAARALLSSCGQVFDVPDESLMDAVTAVSGSGPAYLFHFIEALTEAALAVGLPSDLAGPMAVQTVLGAARLAAEGDAAPGDLRRMVTSPGGTTAAALDVLMGNDGLAGLVRRAVVAARDRGVALGKL
jgi:pyrroline-5-carboxylate reductase